MERWTVKRVESKVQRIIESGKFEGGPGEKRW